MPKPFDPLGLPVIGELVGKMSSLGAQLLFPQAESWGAYIQQKEAARDPMSLPPPDALISAMLKGFFSLDEDGDPAPQFMEHYYEIMRRHGISTGDGPYGSPERGWHDDLFPAWQRVIDSTVQRPGIREAFSAYIAGFTNDKTLALMLQRNGANVGDWKWMIPLLSERLSIDQLVEVWRRGLITEQEFDTYAKLLQYGIPGDIKKLKQLSMMIPGPQDMIRFVIRDVFNPDLVKELGLDQELNENKGFLDWSKAVGLGEVTITNDKGEQLKADFAKYSWYAHWQLPSPGMAYDFMHRGYDESKYGPSPWLKIMPKFGADEINALLKANDFSPRYRKNLIALSFNPLTRVDVRRLHADRIIDEPTVYHNFRAQGYAEPEAILMTKWVLKKSKDAESKAEKDGIKKRVCQSYQMGIIDKGKMRQTMIDVGWKDWEADVSVKLCDIDLSLGLAKDATASIKAGFLSGSFSETETRTQLANVGVSPERVQQLLFNWKLKLSSRRRVVAAKEVSGWFIDGLIAMDEFVSRLTKLEYNAADVTRIIQAAVLEQSKRIAKAQKTAYDTLQKQFEKNLKEAEKRRQEAERLQRLREKQLRDQQAAIAAAEKHRLEQFLSARTEANLRKWLASKEITEEEIRMTFRLKGWIDADITRWLEFEKGKRH